MQGRERLILIVAAAAAAIWIFDRVGLEPFLERRAKVLADRGALEAQRSNYQAVINGRGRAVDEWKRCEGALKKQGQADAIIALNFAMLHITKDVGISLEVTGNSKQKISASKSPGAAVFQEVLLESKFETDWARLIDLLFEIHKSEDLLRTRRLTVRSDYEKADKLEVELRVSTIETNPVSTKGTNQ